MPRSLLTLVLAVLLGALVLALVSPPAAVAQAPDDDCQALDTGPIPNPAQAACDAGEAVVDGGADAVKDVVTAPVTAAGDAVMKGVTTWVANGDPTHQRLLDPSCGSGTFLFWAVRRALDAYETAGISNREALDRVVDKVAGIDLHPVAVTLARGRVPSHHATWAEVEPALKATQADVTATLEVLDGSPYRASFAQGATLVPSVLLRVEVVPTPTFGMASGMRAIRSARSALEKPPWRDVDSLEGVVESAFVHPMLTGASVVPFRQRQAEQVVVPWADGTLLTGGDEHIDAHPGLAEWWRRAERIWIDQRPPSSKMRLNDRIDFQRLLQRQLPAPEHRVVYTASGQHLAACRVDDRTALVEHKLYWGPAASLDEARYLTAVLNSRTLAETVAPLQSRGQHNPRDFDTHVFAVPFPAFDPGSPVQRRLVNLAGRAERVAEEVDVDIYGQFQRARRAVREALAEDGVMTEIDAAVAALLEPLPQPG